VFLNILKGKKNTLLCLIVREAYKKEQCFRMILLKGLMLKYFEINLV